MPTTYTHWRFGNQCILTLPCNLQEVVNNNRDIFDYGVHGPDFFFFYNCIKRNEINEYGSLLHKKPASETIRMFKENIKNVEDKASAVSYILGFVCHFALDSHCHSYIDRAQEVTEFSHARIESQLDKLLLMKDGFDPIKKDVTFSLKPTKKMANTISKLYNNFDEKIVYRSMKDFVFYLKLLKDSSDTKRKMLEYLMKKFNAENFIGLLITKKEYKGIEPILMRLEKLYDKAINHYRKLALNVVDYLEDKKPLDPYFNNTFDDVIDYKSIPVLTLEEEKKYIVDKF